jgi:hypothetical protein
VFLLAYSMAECKQAYSMAECKQAYSLAECRLAEPVSLSDPQMPSCDDSSHGQRF